MDTRPSEPPQEQAVDEDIAAELARYNPEGLLYDGLKPPSSVIEDERAAFDQSNHTTQPDLRLRETDSTEIDEWESTLLAMKQSLPQDLAENGLDAAYRWRINENAANIRILRAAASHDTRRFEAYNSFIYGSPDPETFEAVADWHCQKAEAALDDPRPEVQQAAMEVLERLTDYRGDSALLKPEADLFERVKAEHYKEAGFLALLMDGVELPETGVVDASNGDPALRQMLQNIGSEQELTDADDWSNTPHALARPADFVMTPQEFKEFTGHEVRHAIERQNGMRGPAHIVADGLDRYEVGNEGRSVLTEQVLNEEFEDFEDTWRWHEILDRHLVVSLGSGLAPGKADFANTYKTLQSVISLYEHTHPQPDDTPQAATARAHDKAWQLAVSAYQGTDGSGEGGVYRRPMIYLEGNLAIWRAAAADPTSVAMGDLGKFDISNPRHIAILRASGVLPSDEISG